jgi:hypothetical protein
MSEPSAEQRHRARILAAILFTFVILLIAALLIIGAATD